MVASASADGTLKVWKVSSGREFRTLRHSTDPLAGVALSRDGRLVVSASWDTTLKVWDLETGRELRTLNGHTSKVTSVALGNGRIVVSASFGTLKVGVSSGGELRSMEGHELRSKAWR